MKFASTFSGGFGTANFAMKYEGIEYEDVFACEWMEPQRKSYIQNHGEPKEFYKDIRDLDGTKYEGQIDLLHQSPPCTSYSMAGKREGADSESGSLMWEAIRLIDEVQPKIFIIENVASLKTSNNGEDFRNIMRDLRKLNYSISYGVLNAKEMGTPQNRERLFIVGFRADIGAMPFPSPVPLETTLADLLEDEVDEKYYLSEKMLKGFILHKERHKARGNGFSFKPKMPEDKVANGLSIKMGSRSTDNYIAVSYGDSSDFGGGKIGTSDIHYSMRSGRMNLGVAELQQVGNIDQQGHNSLWGRVYEPQIAATQNANGGGAGAKTGLYLVDAKKSEKPIPIINGKPYRIRRLTPREGARVMGDFDDKFILDGFSDTKLYEFIGNSIDISTYRRLLVRILEFTKDVKWNDPSPIGFKGKSEQPQCTLF